MRDSAGVEIVESRSFRWADGDGLRLDPVPVWEVGSEETIQLHRVFAATRLSNGLSAILNGVTSEVVLVGPDGSVERVFGGDGEGPGELAGPASMFAIRGDSIVIHELFSARVSHFGGDGSYSHSVRVLNSLEPAARGADAQGGLYFSRTRILASGPTTTADAGVPRERGFLAVRVTPTGVIDTLIQRSLAPSIFVQVGGSVYRTLFEPGPWLSAAGGSAVFGMSNEWGFERMDTTGTTTRIFRWIRDPVPASDAIIDQHFTGLYADDDEARSRAEAGIRELPPAPTVPAWTSFGFDRIGRLWVRPFQVGEALESGARSLLYGSMRRGASVPWVVFGSDGVLLGEVEIPPDVRPLDIGGDYVLALWRDDFDVEYVRMYRLVGEDG